MMIKTLRLCILIAAIWVDSRTSTAAGRLWAADSTIRAEVDPVMLSLDSMSFQLFTRCKFFGTNGDIQQAIAIPRDQLPSYSASDMKQRMKMIPAVIPMDYNQDVQAFVDLFVYRRRELMTKLLANSQIYFPMFEEMLDKYHMPDELKYLSVIESALNPQAVSPAGATGLWQLMYGTGKQLGLEANSYIDERRDPIKSTDAGLRYLKQLHDLYGDWQLALAAYNSGPGYVNKAIARAGGVKNFWAIKNLLPAETRSYVPTFLAMVYAMHYHKDYRIVSAEPSRELYAVDTIKLPTKVSLKHIATSLNMPIEELQFLNPAVKSGIVPQVAGGYPLNVPVSYFATFESRKLAIMNDPEIALQESTADMYANPTMVRVPRYVYHKVRRGETLAAIAARYGVTASDMHQWNHIRGNNVGRGQNLKIQTIVEVPVYQTANNTQTSTPAPVTTQHTSTPAPRANNTPASNATNESNEANATADLNGGGGQNGDEQVLYYYEEGKESQKIAAPNTNTTAPTKTTATKAAAPLIRRPNVKYYTVRPGDTLWGIVKHYPGLSVDKLKADNRCGNHVRKGQVLKIVM
jgi:membrane-bound lytic murein transglycosylase D